VLDVDGDPGNTALQRLIEKYGKLPETLTARTGKGEHLYWSYPQSTIRNSASKLGGGLDVRGDGGYVLVPPSVHPSGVAYEWINPTVLIAEAPEWLVCLAAAPALGPVQVAASPTIVEIGPGQRHKRLTHVIGRMLKDGMNTAAVEAAAQAENATFARPSLKQMCANLWQTCWDAMRRVRVQHRLRPGAPTCSRWPTFRRETWTGCGSHICPQECWRC
jgi:hypothetical protein